MSSNIARPQYPFGMERLFDGMPLPAGGGRSFDYVPNEKQFIAHNCCADEIFYGGAVFGGKSWWLLFHNAAHCLQYGPHANTALFRRTYKNLERSLIRDQKRLFHGEEKLGRYIADTHKFEWSNGAVTWFCHLQNEGDVEDHDSAQYSLVGFDELTHFSQDMYEYLFLRCRAASGEKVHCQVLSTSNPRGIGHKWVKGRFLDMEPNVIHEFVMPEEVLHGVKIPEQRISRIYIPAYATDNKAGLDRNPRYLANLRMNLPKHLYEAKVLGNWDQFDDMAFPAWSEDTHVVDDFEIPKEWKVIRCMDAGFHFPFYVGWLAQDPDDKTIYLVREWYGARRGPQGGIKGLRLAARDTGQGIRDREGASVDAGSFPQPRYGVASPDMWSLKGAPKSAGDLINEDGVLFRRAQGGPGARELGFELMQNLLRMDEETGRPGFMAFRSCPEFIRCIGSLVVDKEVDDVAGDQEDHPYEGVRYGLVELKQAPARGRREQDVPKRRRMPAYI